MTDFHTHILPCVDDGSQSMEQSLQRLSMQIQQGVGRVVLTPHFYPQYQELDEFLQQRDAAFEALQAAVKDLPQCPNLYLGAEVHYYAGMSNSEELRRLQNEKDQPLAKVAEDPKIPGKDNTHKNGNDKKVIDNPQEQKYSDHVKSLPQLSETEHAIVGCLGEGPCLADEIIATTGLGTGAVLAALTTLEIKGVVQRLPGKRVCLKS